VAVNVPSGEEIMTSPQRLVALQPLSSHSPIESPRTLSSANDLADLLVPRHLERRKKEIQRARGVEPCPEKQKRGSIAMGQGQGQGVVLFQHALISGSHHLPRRHGCHGS
jgi:hypothetical protein